MNYEIVAVNYNLCLYNSMPFLLTRLEHLLFLSTGLGICCYSAEPIKERKPGNTSS